MRFYCQRTLRAIVGYPPNSCPYKSTIVQRLGQQVGLPPRGHQGKRIWNHVSSVRNILKSLAFCIKPTQQHICLPDPPSFSVKNLPNCDYAMPLTCRCCSHDSYQPYAFVFPRRSARPSLQSLRSLPPDHALRSRWDPWSPQRRAPWPSRSSKRERSS